MRNNEHTRTSLLREQAKNIWMNLDSRFVFQDNYIRARVFARNKNNRLFIKQLGGTQFFSACSFPRLFQDVRHSELHSFICMGKNQRSLFSKRLQNIPPRWEYCVDRVLFTLTELRLSRSLKLYFFNAILF